MKRFFAINDGRFADGHFESGVYVNQATKEEVEEKSYRDTALILQCSEGTVASRMNRAKAILAAKLRRSAPGRLNMPEGIEGKEGADVGTAIEANGN